MRDHDKHKHRAKQPLITFQAKNTPKLNEKVPKVGAVMMKRHSWLIKCHTAETFLIKYSIYVAFMFCLITEI
jgi:hypothetical protein